MIPPFVAISGWDQDQFYKAPAGAFAGRVAAQGGFTAAVFVWPQGTQGETHSYFANTDGATYGWWFDRTSVGAFRVHLVTTLGVVTAQIASGAGAVGQPMLLHLTLTNGNTLQLYVNGSFFSETSLGAGVYVPAPGAAVATVGARDTAGTEFMGGLLGGVAYVEPAQSADLYGLHWAACHGARDMVDQPSGYGLVVPAYTNVFSARRSNNGAGQEVALPGLAGFVSAAPTWADEHGLITLEEQGDGLFVATLLGST